MLLTKIKTVTAALLVLGAVVFGGALLSHQMAAAEHGQAEAQPAEEKKTDAPRAKVKQKPIDDLDALQGKWMVERAEVNGKKIEEDGGEIVIKGKTWSHGGEPYPFAIDPTTKPKSITLKDRPDAFVTEGIYKIEGDTLVLCLDKSLQEGKRPSDFSTKPGSLTYLVVLKKEQPKGREADEPTTARGYYERGCAHEQEKRYPEALKDYSKAIELDPRFIDAYYSRSALYSGHPSIEKRNYANAVADLSKILDIEPKRFSARYNRALCYESLREYDKAIADYSKVIDGDTDFSRDGKKGKDDCLAWTHHYRGRAYQWYKSDYAKAAADYTEALRLDPQMEMVHYRRGQAFHALKEFAKAQDDFEVALRRDPDYPNLLNSWAWQLATCPEPKYRDGKKALEYASKANKESGGKSPECLDTVAAAYAEAGQFDEAITSQKKAIELLGAKGNEQRKAMQARLKLYEAGKPFRTE